MIPWLYFDYRHHLELSAEPTLLLKMTHEEFEDQDQILGVEVTSQTYRCYLWKLLMDDHSSQMQMPPESISLI
jgi:hypothetical protein